jgi:hypothetical protein
MSNPHTLVPIYTTKGDVGALLSYPYLYNPLGEWIGWVTPDRQVYSVHGQYVGWLSGDPRILRKPADSFDMPRHKPPVAPPFIRVPARFPLPAMMPELTQGVIDVLEDMPDLLPCVDFGELREDMD